MKRITALLLLTALVALGAAGCGDDDDDDSGAAGDNVLHITEDEYSYEIDGDVDAGTVTFDVDNVGDEFHMIALCALQTGKTIGDVLEAAQEEDESAFGEVCKEDASDALGGGSTPGTRYGITATGIEAGNYVAICFLPDKDGKPHFLSGMIEEFEIGEGNEDAEITGDVTYTATEEKLSGPTELDAGETTFEYVPGGGRDEFTVLKIRDGKTVDDVDAWFEELDEGAFYTDADSPVDFLYFAFDDEKTRSLTVDLTPGNWVFAASDSDSDAEEPDPNEDPHVIQFTVS